MKCLSVWFVVSASVRSIARAQLLAKKQNKNQFDKKNRRSVKNITNKTLGILGGGQLGMFLCMSAKKLGKEVVIYSESKEFSAKNFSSKFFHISIGLPLRQSNEELCFFNV